MKILVGAGGMAIDFLTYYSPAYCGLVDDKKVGTLLGHPIIGTISEFIQILKGMPPRNLEIYNCIGSVGNNQARNEVYTLLKESGIETKNVIMSSFISKNVEIGRNVLANIASQIHHGVVIEDNVVISPCVCICGDVHLCRNVFIGAGAIVIQGKTIGENAVIAAGAVVTRDVPADSVLGGIPAKSIK